MDIAKEGFRNNFNAQGNIEDKVKDTVEFFFLILKTFGIKCQDLQREN